jgi:hypothetical protein
MINYEWTCESLNCYAEKDGKKNVAYGVNFKVVGTSDNFKEDGTPYSMERMDSFDLPDIKEGDVFLEFEDLTSDDVINWVKSGIGESGVEHIKANIAESLEILSRPVIEKVTLTLNK